MAKRALLVGIDDYHNVAPLAGCAADARAMAAILKKNDNDSPNFDCRLLTCSAGEPITRAVLRRSWSELFRDFDGDVLFYFSGHGYPTELGGYLVTQEGTPDDPGLAMNDVVHLANLSRARSVLIILDCCHSGAVGNYADLQSSNQSPLKEGVTILAASRPGQAAFELDGHGVFTRLLLGALRGGAADVRGRVSAASIYAYAEAALGGLDQRPMYKSHAARLEPVRICEAKVEDALLRELLVFFPEPDAEYRLDETYEETNSAAKPEHVAVFRKFKILQIAGLLKPKEGFDLFWTAERSGFVQLTTLGIFYRQLASAGRL
ncbi:caspase family protein [Bradyrhizobium vignae]|uniref:Putative peptidase protein (Caspase-1 like protein) n=1 Tax=Bradyrhizobium vignae TaxID=1549949 RepID=A0A2U3PUE2_9BRAD|nr:caspase family protein [Bradyrhizobium vignae]SPP92762.1 putative peptidase protein (Caspase-1 like protein) [Bradyrhizobium vignae]